MNNYLTIRKIQQPHTKHILEICVANDKIDISKIVSDFSRACTIVDAQFYYTNPLLFIFVDPMDCSEFAQLYVDYFLVPPRYYDAIEINTDAIAVNASFIHQICSLNEFSEEDPSLKQTHKEFQENVDTQPSPLNSLYQLYQDKGLYIIGIRRKNEEL